MRTKIKLTIKLFLKKFRIYISRSPIISLAQFKSDLNLALCKNAGGVLHIGAHYGQERFTYQELDLKVIWFEAQPSVFDVLKKNLESIKDQYAICALLGEKNTDNVPFYITNNEGASSSLFPLSTRHGFSALANSATESGDMKRLDSLLTSEDISPYRHWIIDVQGAELEVLKGAGILLDFCASLCVESSSREIYIGGIQFSDLCSYLNERGFTQLWELSPGGHEDVIFIRKSHYS
jgi:FkbM family methyltransferase